MNWNPGPEYRHLHGLAHVGDDELSDDEFEAARAEAVEFKQRHYRALSDADRAMLQALINA